MKQMLKDFNNVTEERLNYGLMDREYDDSLVEYIVNSCKSLEVLDYITFEGYEYIEDESKIDINKYIHQRKKSKKTEHIKYRYITDSRYAEMILHFKITFKDKVKFIKKPILIPVPDEDGFYLIKGTKYFMLYQLVDASTYNTPEALTLKSLMPVSLKRNLQSDSKDYKDTDGVVHSAPTYSIKVFKKYVDIMIFYFAKVGVQSSLEFFGVDYIVDFVPEIGDTKTNIYFQINSKLFLEVNREFFTKYQYVRSIIFMILSISTNRLNMDNLHSKHYWIEKLGSSNNTKQYNYYEKGLSSLTYFDRLLDENTKKVVKIHPSHKKNIYTIIRWMIQNYNELRKKDNLDLTNKRLRCNEYIASLLTKSFSDRVNRVIGYGNKVTIDRISEIFKFNGDIIIKQLHKSGLLRYDDNVNDMDMFSKLKFTLNLFGAL